MKLAITADIHLTSRDTHPERYHALENILAQMLSDGIDTLVVAGDLFDASSQNYSEFDDFCRQPEYAKIKFFIIPGNHDARIDKEFLTADNVVIFSEPTLKPLNAGLKFLFLPYKQDKTMGEFIAEHSKGLSENEWILIGHGDWAGGLREPNPLEPGVYMPLTRSDVDAYRPIRVVLGHIHKPVDNGRVHFVGSPCGLDITETGRRRFLVMDSHDAGIETRTVDSDFIFFNESFVILPLQDERSYVKKLIADRIQEWKLDDSELSKARVSVRFRGYTSDKNALQQIIKEAFRNVRFYKDWEPDLSNVAVSDDLNLAEIAGKVQSWLDSLVWQPGVEDPDKEQALLEALHVIYGNG